MASEITSPRSYNVFDAISESQPNVYDEENEDLKRKKVELTKEILKQKDLGPSLRDRDGSTVLHAACRVNYAVLVGELLLREDVQACLDARDNQGNTPFHVTVFAKADSVVEKLRPFSTYERIGRAINSTGDTPFTLAVAHDFRLPLSTELKANLPLFQEVTPRAWMVLSLFMEVDVHDVAYQPEGEAATELPPERILDRGDSTASLETRARALSRANRRYEREIEEAKAKQADLKKIAADEGLILAKVEENFQQLMSKQAIYYRRHYFDLFEKFTKSSPPKDLKDYFDCGGDPNLIEPKFPGEVGAWKRRSLLHVQCEEGRYDAAYFLIQKGASTEAFDSDAKTPFQVYRSKVKITGKEHKELSRAFENPIDETDVYKAVKRKDVMRAMRSIQTFGGNINAKDREGLALLHHAILIFELMLVEALLVKGANPNLETGERETPINILNRNKMHPNYNELLNLLIKFGNDPGISLTPSDSRIRRQGRASDSGTLRLASPRLRRHNGTMEFDPDASAQEAVEIAQRAALAEQQYFLDTYKGETAAVMYRIKDSANNPSVTEKTKDSRGNTSLHIAAKQGHFDLVDRLLTDFPDMHAEENLDGTTSSALAVEAKQPLILMRIAYLRSQMRDKKGPKMNSLKDFYNIKDRDQRGAIDLAIEKRVDMDFFRFIVFRCAGLEAALEKYRTVDGVSKYLEVLEEKTKKYSSGSRSGKTVK